MSARLVVGDRHVSPGKQAELGFALVDGRVRITFQGPGFVLDAGAMWDELRLYCQPPTTRVDVAIRARAIASRRYFDGRPTRTVIEVYGPEEA